MIIHDVEAKDKGTHNLRPGWMSAAQAAQSIAAQSRGACVVSMRIVVNSKGHAVCWTTPELTKIEPGSRSDGLIGVICGEALDNSQKV